MPDEATPAPRIEDDAQREPQQKPIKIFVSHKMEKIAAGEDGTGSSSGQLACPKTVGRTGREFAKIIRNISGTPILGAYTADDSLPAGKNYRADVRSNLDDSDLFVLLFTDEKQDWIWPLYEAGWFSGVSGERDEERPIICLHPSTISAPDPIGENRSVPVIAPSEEVRNGTVEEKKGFIDQSNSKLLTDFVEPLLEGRLVKGGPVFEFTKDKHYEIAFKIAELFLPAEQTERFIERKILLEFHGSDLSELASESDFFIRDDLSVKSDPDGNAFGIFDSIRESEEWSTLKDFLQKESGQPIIDAVTRAVFCALDKKPMHVVPETFRGQDKNYYRPSIYRIDEVKHSGEGDHNRQCAVHMLLARQPGPAAPRGDETSHKIIGYLGLGHHLRSEIIVRGFDELKKLGKEEPDTNKIKQVAQSLVERFDSIVRMAEYKNLVDEDKARATFDYSPKAERKISEMFKEWHTCDADIRQSAVDPLNVVKLKNAITRFRDLNNRFTAFAAKEYYKRVRKERGSPGWFARLWGT